jgi:hypothetical protein
MISKRTAGLVVLRASIWGIAGAFYGVVFVVTLTHLASGELRLVQVVVAAGVAGAVIGAFYSARRVALVGGIAGALAGLVYLTTIETPERVWPVLGCAAGLGLAGGMVASRFLHYTHAALTVAATGLAAGAVAGLLAVALAALTGVPAGAFGFALLMAPVTGVLFTFVLLRLGARGVPVPPWLNVGPVAAIVAGVVGVGLWTLAADLGYTPDADLRATIGAILAKLPAAFGGGLLGGALAGGGLELLGVRWLDGIVNDGG